MTNVELIDTMSQPRPQRHGTVPIPKPFRLSLNSYSKRPTEDPVKNLATGHWAKLQGICPCALSLQQFDSNLLLFEDNILFVNWVNSVGP